MKKYRISTTISPKHAALLKKHAESLDSQQKVLELALECYDDRSRHLPPLSPEDELWLRIGMEVKSACIVQKDALKELLYTADMERLVQYVANEMPIVYVLEYYYQKPLRDCSLKELIEGMVINARASHWLETVDYTDDGDHFTLKITHDLGMNGSLLHKAMCENVFHTYGVKTASKVSERSVFITAYKTRIEK